MHQCATIPFEDGTTTSGPTLIGSSRAMRAIREQLATAARYEEPALILGETGTGKELVARGIHELGERGSTELVVVNCGAVTEELLAAELFGHVAGAFTGATRDRAGKMRAADGSTLLLDEVSETPRGFQVALLRVLESGEVQPVGSDRSERVDVRFLATSNRPLEELARGAAFRSDLLHRLTAFVIEVPPLRRRRQDIPEIVAHFLDDLGGRYGRRPELGPGCLELLHRHPFPGNVRELRQIVFRAYAATEGETIEAPAIDVALLQGCPPASLPPGTAPSIADAAAALPGGTADAGGADDGRLRLHDHVRSHLQRAIAVAGFNLAEAARLLDIPRSTLQHYLGKYDIDLDSLRLQVERSG